MCFNRRIWKLQRLERDGRNGNANAACHRATGRLVAPDSWYRSDQPSRDPFFSFCRPVFAPFSRHVVRNNIIERRAKTPGADSVLEKNLFYQADQIRFVANDSMKNVFYHEDHRNSFHFAFSRLASLRGPREIDLSIRFPRWQIGLAEAGGSFFKLIPPSMREGRNEITAHPWRDTKGVVSRSTLHRYHPSDRRLKFLASPPTAARVETNSFTLRDFVI